MTIRGVCAAALAVMCACAGSPPAAKSADRGNGRALKAQTERIGEVVDTGDPFEASGSIGDNHVLVKAALAAYPNHDIIVCLAGCLGRAGTVVYAKAKTGAASTVAQAPSANPSTVGSVTLTAATDAEVCLTDCDGVAGDAHVQSQRVVWISGPASDDLEAALRAMVNRLGERGDGERRGMRAWVSARAADHLEARSERAAAR